MFISLVNFIVNTCLFAIIYFLKNRLPKLRKIKIINEQRVKGALFFLSLSVLIAGLAWYLPAVVWLNIVASLLSLIGISMFFNTMDYWFKKTQHRKVRREDLMTMGIWLLWLLSVSIFLANILVIALY